MLATRLQKNHSSETGEGNLRLVFFLALLVIGGYLAIKDLPVYFNIQNCKHDLAELARGAGVVKMPAPRVQAQALRIANDYQIDPKDIKVEQLPNGGIKISLDTVRKLDVIVTDYDWQVSAVFTQSPF